MLTCSLLGRLANHGTPASTASAGASRTRLLGSPSPRWLPLLLLAAFAVADFAAQAALPAVAAAAAAGWLPVPPDALEWVRTVVGLSPQAHGLELALRLLRPLALLAAIAAYRSCYCLGTLHRQLEREALLPAAQEAHRCGGAMSGGPGCCASVGAAWLEQKGNRSLHPRRLRAELGWRALGKRALLLHGSKLVALLALGAAMQQPGAVGLVLAGGIVLLAPQLGAPTPGATRQQPLLLTALMSTAVLATAWMVAQYAVCLPWVQVGRRSRRTAARAERLGLTGRPEPRSIPCPHPLLPRTCCCACLPMPWTLRTGPACACRRRPPPAVAAAAAWLRSWRCCCASRPCCWWPLRCACAPSGEGARFDRTSCACRMPACGPLPSLSSTCRWQAKLPEEVRAAGRCGAPCPLFWPQSPDYTPPAAPHSPAMPGQRRLGPLSLVESLREAAAVLLSRAQHVTQQALRAVDWPAEAPEPAEAAAAAARSGQPPAGGSAAQPEAAVAVARQRQWRLLRFALQDWLESIWQARMLSWFLPCWSGRAERGTAHGPVAPRWLRPSPTRPPLLHNHAKQEWHLDIALVLLLLAAFSAANALSLACVAVVGLGMWLPARATQVRQPRQLAGGRGGFRGQAAVSQRYHARVPSCGLTGDVPMGGGSAAGRAGALPVLCAHRPAAHAARPGRHVRRCQGEAAGAEHPRGRSH